MAYCINENETRELTYKHREFFDYILAQDPERRIDQCGGWTSCAVGDFTKDTAGPATTIEVRLRRDSWSTRCAQVSYTHIPERVREVFANAACQSVKYAHGDLETYGGLQAFIVKQYPEYYGGGES